MGSSSLGNDCVEDEEAQSEEDDDMSDDLDEANDEDMSEDADEANDDQPDDFMTLSQFQDGAHSEALICKGVHDALSSHKKGRVEEEGSGV